jgi:hypothetical protein
MPICLLPVNQNEGGKVDSQKTRQSLPQLRKRGVLFAKVAKNFLGQKSQTPFPAKASALGTTYLPTLQWRLIYQQSG